MSAETITIRPFQWEDEAQVVELWLRANLVVPWNDPHHEIFLKMAWQPELFFVAVASNVSIEHRVEPEQRVGPEHRVGPDQRVGAEQRVGADFHVSPNDRTSNLPDADVVTKQSLSDSDSGFCEERGLQPRAEEATKQSQTGECHCEESAAQRMTKQSPAFNTSMRTIETGEERVVGTVMAGYEGHRGWINYLASDRLGVGKLLIEHAERKLRELGCPKINLQVRESNKGVVHFYQSLGYTIDPLVNLGKRL